MPPDKHTHTHTVSFLPFVFFFSRRDKIYKQKNDTPTNSVDFQISGSTFFVCFFFEGGGGRSGVSSLTRSNSWAGGGGEKKG